MFVVGLPDKVEVHPATKIPKIVSAPVNPDATRPTRMVIPKHQWGKAGLNPSYRPPRFTVPSILNEHLKHYFVT